MPAAPRCPHCNAQGINHLAHRLLGGYVLVYCGQCGAIYGVVPAPPQKQQPPPPISQSAPNNKSSQPATLVNAPERIKLFKPMLDHLGQVDLTGRQPYSPQSIAARLKAAGYNRATAYRQIAIEDGPPCCPNHHSDMVLISIPAGYPNSGRKVWVCTAPGCRNWELAE